MPVPDLPSRGSTDWYEHYGALHDAVTKGDGLYTAIPPLDGEVGVTDTRYEPGRAERYGGAADADATAVALRTLVETQSVSTGRYGEIALYVMTFPAGDFTITSLEGLVRDDAPVGRQGLLIQGAGRDATTIRFAPSTPGWLMRNNNRWQHITIRDIRFIGGGPNANFLHSTSQGHAQGNVYERIVWDGEWDTGFLLDGTDTNSEWKFWGCSIWGRWGTFLRQDNPQGLNYDFVSCDLEPASGNGLVFTKGGHINVIGGSWIGGKSNDGPPGSGTLISLSSAGGVETNRLLVMGVRTEYRSPDYLFLDCSWGTGTVEFHSFHDTGSADANARQAEATRFTFNSNEGGFPIVDFTNCRLAGRHRYVVDVFNDHHRRSISYTRCIVQNHEDMASFVEVELAPEIVDRDGARPPIRFSDCDSSAIPVALRGRNLHDQTLNAFQATNAVLQTHVVSMKSAFGDLPNGSAPTTSVRIPLGAVITRCQLHQPAGRGSTDTTWGWTLSSGDGTTIYSHTGERTGTAQYAGIDHVQDVVFHCTTDERRTITLTATNGTSGVSDDAFFLLHYLS
jgi:hypothetical protein